MLAVPTPLYALPYSPGGGIGFSVGGAESAAMWRQPCCKIFCASIFGIWILLYITFFFLHPHVTHHPDTSQQKESGQSDREPEPKEYRWTRGNAYASKTFSGQWSATLRRLGLHFSDSDNDDNEDDAEASLETARTVIVTAFSNNHFEDGSAMLRTVREFQTNVTQPLVYLYDLGLSKEKKSELREQFGDFIEIRQFAFDQYPSHVSDLHQYRWKPLIVAEIFATTQHKLFWWFDSSVRIRYDRDLNWYLQDYFRSGGDWRALYPVVFPHYTSHSIFAATAPVTYHYFPINETMAKKTNMYGATVFAAFKRRMVERDILKWWVLCALEKDCMAPAGSSLGCAFGPGPARDTAYAQCHRFDQSVLNVLVAAANDFNVSRYWRDEPHRAIQVERMQ